MKHDRVTASRKMWDVNRKIIHVGMWPRMDFLDLQCMWITGLTAGIDRAVLATSLPVQCNSLHQFILANQLVARS